MSDIDPYDDDLDWVPNKDPDELRAPADEITADWMLRRLHRTADEVEQIIEVFDTEIDKLAARRDDLLAGPQRQMREITEALQSYGLMVRSRDGRKRVDLPHGTISTRTGTATVDVADPVALSGWCSGLGDDDPCETLITVPDQPAPRPSKTAVKKAVKDGVLHVLDTGEVVVAATGEVVPGVVWVEGDVAAKVELL